MLKLTKFGTVSLSSRIEKAGRQMRVNGMKSASRNGRCSPEAIQLEVAESADRSSAHNVAETGSGLSAHEK